MEEPMSVLPTGEVEDRTTDGPKKMSFADVSSG